MGILDWITGGAFTCHEPSMPSLAVSASLLKYSKIQTDPLPAHVCYTFILDS